MSPDREEALLTTALIILGGAAVLRLNRLVMADTITEPARVWIAEHLPLRVSDWIIGPGGLLSCVWCTSIWTGAAVSGVLVGSGSVDLGAPWWVAWPLLTLGYSLLSGWIAAAVDAVEAYNSYPGEQ